MIAPLSPDDLEDMIEQNHTLSVFDEALAALHGNVVMMASLTEQSLERATNGLLRRDNELCAKAIADDDEIDQLEKDVDRDGVDLLLRFQPLASDLRGVVSAMKLSTNLERVADQAVKIARKARRLNRHPQLPEVDFVQPMFSHATAMFRDSLHAYLRGDVELARALKLRDKALDEMNAAASRRLIERMSVDSEQLRGYLNLMFIARHLERVGDHATNIGEDAVFAASAEDIRHQPSLPAGG